ncbi:MAG: DoxX family membrane protein [Bacteroidales bacterium]|nr:DoxX family membrane protein [Bacteroidales bacterium]MCF8397714.1 DoxX family membrane protein [Bacteroidales bacterium]
MKYTTWQKTWLLILRLSIGWHLLYEGLAKLTNPNWSSVAYLMDSEGFLKNFYEWMVSSPGILKVVDFANIWGLIAIGLGIFIGLFTRVAIIAGILLLSLYYLSHPPFVGLEYSFPSGGNYLFVNSILIEILALAVLFKFPTQFEYGIDKFICKSSKN